MREVYGRVEGSDVVVFIIVKSTGKNIITIIIIKVFIERQILSLRLS